MTIAASKTPTDSQLLARIEQGDSRSFELLFHRHYGRVFGLLYRLVGERHEAEDLAQEVFLKLYQLGWSDRREHNVGAWLYRVATHTGYNAVRSRRRRWQRDTKLLPDETDRPADPAEIVADREMVAQARAALRALRPEQVQLLLLRQMGLSYRELSSACGIRLTSVGKQLSRAAEAFRQQLEGTENR